MRFIWLDPGGQCDCCLAKLSMYHTRAAAVTWMAGKDVHVTYRACACMLFLRSQVWPRLEIGS